MICIYSLFSDINTYSAVGKLGRCQTDIFSEK